jgi:ATP-dependent helicase/nuclease subunit A
MENNAQQIAAINDEGLDILVSAGAGSGKTRVLTERVIRKIRNGQPLTRLLILTFTQNAAHSMKGRIKDAIKLNGKDNPLVLKELKYVDSADIMTFDAFNHKLVKRYFYKLGIQENFQNVSESILNVELYKIIDEVFEEKFEAGDPAFLKVMDLYTIKNEDNIKDLIIQMINKESPRPDPSADFKAFMEGDELNKHLEEIYQIITEAGKEVFKGFLSTLKKCADDDPAYGEIKKLVLGEFSNVDGNRSFGELKAFYQRFKDHRYAKKRGVESAFKPLYDGAKDKMSKFFRSVDINVPPSDKAREIFTNRKEENRTIYKLAIEIEDRFAQFKKEKNAYSFSDIAKMALKLLKEDEGVRKDMAASYDEIMVDEYQDNNDLQEAFLSFIQNEPAFIGNLFLVGDVKQSIYRFRNSNPKYFAQRYRQYRDGDKKQAEVIDMNTNYRSTSTVTGDINNLFKELMPADYGPIDYSRGHEISSGLKDIETVTLPSFAYSYSRDGNGPAPDMIFEAKAVASDILKRLAAKETVTFESGKKHVLTYGDFTILVDRGTSFDDIAKVFKDYGIPLKIEKNQDVFSQQISSLIKSLLQLAASVKMREYDSMPFRHALLAVERGPAGKMSQAEINALMTSDDLSKAEAVTRMQNALEKSKGNDLISIYDAIIDEFGIYNLIKNMKDPGASYQFLTVFYTFVQQMSYLGYSPFQAVSFFKALKEDDSLKGDVAIASSFSDAVTLTNIHKSKGLEYPIVYYIGLSKRYNLADNKDRFVYSADYGLILPFITDDYKNEVDENKKPLFTVIPDNPYRFALALKSLQEQREEEIRLLYVALTRAQWQMIFLFNDPKVPEGGFAKPAFLYSAMSFKDLFVYAEESFFVHRVIITAEDFCLVPLSSGKKAQKKDGLVFTYKPIGEVDYGKKTVRASKEGGGSSEEKLEFGRQVHLAMQALDFDKKNLGFIQDPTIRKAAEKFLSSSLFAQYGSYQAYKEYNFIDPESLVTGSIDLLWVGKDDMAIIDYKLKDITDEEYVRQLGIYKKNAERIFHKPCKCYLYALLTAQEQEIC